MDTSFWQAIAENYHLGLSLATLAGILAVEFIAKRLVLLVPAFRTEHGRNVDAFKAKMEKPNYAQNQRWNRKWGLIFLAIIFGAIMPFCVTLDGQAWWKYPLDVFVILMVYDFFYYLTHKYLFHDNGFLGGPLVWVHAVHHRQHNPCRMDSSYIHPIEVAIGLGLYVAMIALLSVFMGKFHVGTIIFTWLAFQQINLHNHDLWESNRFPFRYLNYAAQMHHNHHARFTGGNYATITLLYDWMFGTLDDGLGWGKHRKVTKAAAAAAPAAQPPEAPSAT